MIKQRVLYIGLGGSGIDLGLALDKALKHEICGLDGRQLLQRPGFAEFEPNVIPSFVQYLFIDFAQGQRKETPGRQKYHNCAADRANN